MGEFLDAAVGFPAMLFSAALVVVVGFWTLVLCGAAEHDGFDTDVDADALHLGAVPVSVTASLFVAVGWILSLSGSVLLDRAVPPGALASLLSAALLLLALLGAWRATRLLVPPLARLFPDEPGPSRHDFVGLTCVIRTGRVDADFGQAEVTARDGSTAVVQVRQPGHDPLALGSTGLLYEYDESGEFFWVAPYDTALDPRTPRTSA